MDIMKEYKLLLTEIDNWFSNCHKDFLDDIACGKGCSACCCGLFDITVLDAALLNSGFSGLDDEVKGSVRKKAAESLRAIQAYWPEFNNPFILNYRPEEDREALMATDNDTPCALLDDEGRCLLYHYRPMTCRLHGLPLIDISGEVMESEWCTKNFINNDPLKISGLRGEFNRVFQKEAALGRHFTEELLGRAVSELDTFIPTALLTDYKELDWRKWLAENPLKT